jgi:integrase
LVYDLTAIDTRREVERLIEATNSIRHEVRDRCLLLLIFRHGLRVSEACRMKLDQVDSESGVLHVARLKGGLSTTHPLRGDEAAGNRRMAHSEAHSGFISGTGTFSTPSNTRRPIRQGSKSYG